MTLRQIFTNFSIGRLVDVPVQDVMALAVLLLIALYWVGNIFLFVWTAYRVEAAKREVIKL